MRMMRAAIAEARAFDSWSDVQEASKRAIAPLTTEQLQRRVLPGRRTPGEIAEHIVFGRAFHLKRALGDAAADLTPLLSWDHPAESPRTAAEILAGLDATWQVIVAAIMSGAATDVIAVGEEPSALQLVWGLLDHDLPHAGQLSLLLRAGGLPGVDI
jgi:uncharacterized damage-inducible protein DinB